MTAASAPREAPFRPGDLRCLWELAGRLRASWRYRPAAARLDALLLEIEASRRDGPDMLHATAYGNSVPEMKADALARAVSFWGPDADLAIEEIGAVRATFTREGRNRGQFYADARVRCLNYAEVSS